KYLNDASPKNKYWARYSTVFTVAEVNLMEKQLLFLLDFDLRIDNSDLNEAAAVFFNGGVAADVLLTPTTPPATAPQQPAAVAEPVSALPAAPPIGDSAHMSVGYKPIDGYVPCTAHKPQTDSKIYPPTLGLGSSSEAQNPAKRQASGCHAYTLRETAITEPSTRLADKRQNRLTSAISSTSTKTPTSLLRQMPTDDKATLHPSPKKRAVSRGHLSNVPHPSPVYHHTGMQSMATTVQMPSAATASSACFLQPLEQATIKYASSRYQQQRYDPQATQGRQGTRTMPRASVSIPSFRAADAVPSGTSPLGHLSGSSAAGSSRRPKDQRTLRHQSTLPDMGRLGSERLANALHAHGTGPELSAMPQSLAAMMKAHLNAPALPVLAPPPARLASGSYRSDYSPGNTLVYEPSPITAGCSVDRLRSYSRQPSESHGTLDTLPVSALSALSVEARKLQAAAEHAGSSDYETDRTLSYSHAPGSRGHYVPQGYNPPSNSGFESSATNNSSSSNNNNNAGGGWQLKSKLLHPLSSWFRSSRHHSVSHEPASSPGVASAPKYVLDAAYSQQPCNLRSGAS
ncbi:PHO85 cyclin-1, partial [Coemansia sp. RSA 2610]